MHGLLLRLVPTGINPRMFASRMIVEDLNVVEDYGTMIRDTQNLNHTGLRHTTSVKLIHGCKVKCKKTTDAGFEPATFATFSHIRKQSGECYWTGKQRAKPLRQPAVSACFRSKMVSI